MQDATYWAEQLALGKISFSELTAQIEANLQQIDPTLNALVSFDRQAAIQQFEQNPQAKTALFGGQPIPLKILGQSKAGWPTTSAAALFANAKAEETSSFVNGLEQLGLIPLGQTNAPEFGFKNVTDPVLYGPTRNPWQPAYSAGGSSGGAAAVVAAGLFPMAAASDGGGSIRIPASFNGLIGLKPTRGAMPVGPQEWRSWQGASINFALTLSMRDTESLFYGLRTSQPAAPYQAPRIEWKHHGPSQNRTLRVAYTTDSPVGSPVSQTAVSAVKKAVVFLEDQGHQVTEIPYPVDGQRMMSSYYRMNGGETAAMFVEIEALLKRPVEQKDMELMTWGLYQYGKKLAAADYIHALQHWDQLAVTMETLFADYDLFLTPTTAQTAPLIEEDLQSDPIRRELQAIEGQTMSAAEELIYLMFDKSLALTPYTQLANLTGQPAISLPTAISEEGLPLGIQFMASKGREDVLFQVGELFEQAGQFHLPKKQSKIDFLGGTR
ncbi:amidase [Enterococcus sp.]|uniref:amidase n=1 Tax=Enterococcus sp. TaxID=35783 RepID=UPI0025BFD564|nr:amidase [Enterococcus sp.]